jgi:uncharacterized protein (DUF111 family)
MRLLMAQVDDVPGEQIGEFIRQAEALGARNVQVVASLTKKGRPGYIIYLDVAAELETEAGLLLGSELGTWGYRVLAAEHRHFDITRVDTALGVTIGGTAYQFELRAKTIADGPQVLRVKAEHDDLAQIGAALREQGHRVPLAVLKAAVESALYVAADRGRIEISF